MSNPRKSHWKATKRIQRYLIWSKDAKLTYHSSNDSVNELYDYVDPDY